MNDTGIYVQYRSYLNYQLPSEVPSVVFLSLARSRRLVWSKSESKHPILPTHAPLRPNICVMSNLSYRATSDRLPTPCKLNAQNQPRRKDAGMAPVRLFIEIIQ